MDMELKETLDGDEQAIDLQEHIRSKKRRPLVPILVRVVLHNLFSQVSR